MSDAEVGSLPVLKVGGPVGGPGLLWVLGLVPLWPAGELDLLSLLAILFGDRLWDSFDVSFVWFSDGDLITKRLIAEELFILLIRVLGFHWEGPGLGFQMGI